MCISSLHLQIHIVRAGHQKTITIQSMSLQIQQQTFKVELEEAYLLCYARVRLTVKAHKHCLVVLMQHFTK